MQTKIVAGIEALAALLIIGASTIWAPVCQKLLTLDNGNQVHMKCHYAGQAAVLIAAIILVSAVIAFLAKKDHKLVQVIVVVCAITIFVVFTDYMGICKSSDMMCHTTAIWVRVGAGIAGIAAVADMLMGKEGQLPS